MANIKFTYAAVTLLSLTTVANSISASNTFTNLTYAAAPARSISFTTEFINISKYCRRGGMGPPHPLRSESEPSQPKQTQTWPVGR